MDVLRNLVEDAMDDFRDQVRKDILNLHVEMIKLFQIQQVGKNLDKTLEFSLLQNISVLEVLIQNIKINHIFLG